MYVYFRHPAFYGYHRSYEQTGYEKKGHTGYKEQWVYFMAMLVQYVTTGINFLEEASSYVRKQG
jgi:hypothetical protein